MKLINYLLLMFLLPALSFGQGIVSQRVQKASTKVPATSVKLFTESNQTLKDVGVSERDLTAGLVLDLQYDAIAELRNTQPEVVEMTFNLPGYGQHTMTLIPNKVLTDDFILRTSDGKIIDYTPGLYYYGTLNDDPKSLVALSVFEQELHGLISTSYGNFVLGKLEDKRSDVHILYNDIELVQTFDLGCETPDDGVGYKPSQLVAPADKDAGDCVRVYVEIDDDIVSNKGGATGATNYVTGIFNESITLYANDGLSMVVSEMFAWTSPAPYSGSSSSAMLSSYQANTGAFNGDLSHLLSYQASGGIAAGFSGICNANVDNSKCFSSIDASYNTVPTYSFTVMVVTHEMGHLIGSRHTHACVWNGNNTAIDSCAGGTEGGCSSPGSPSGGGTIMSYCHLTTGIDFTQGFGPQPKAVILNSVANGSCLSPCGGGGGPTCTDGVQNGNETGVDCGGPDCPACPTACTDTEVTVTITFDNYPEETSWQITNSGGSVVASGGTYGSQPDGSTVAITACLADGCYDFTINDDYGDGICCAYGSGSYTVTGGGSTLASGGAFASSETTNFCVGGSSPILGCTDPSAHNYDSSATQDDGSCETCSDGVQNGDETGVDCGGSLCSACPTGGGEILGSYFESGWDGWSDGGSDCYRYSGSRSWEGNYSIRIRDNSGTASAMTSPSLDLSGYSSIDVTFYFYAYSMESGEDFWLRYYDGSSWTTVAAWASGTSFNNNTFYTATVTLNSASYNFPSNGQIRFQCDASANADHVYIDQVTVTASSGGLIEATDPIVVTERIGDIPEVSGIPEVALREADLNLDKEIHDAVHIFPNPAQDMLNVRSHGEMQTIRIVSATGQVIEQFQVKGAQKALDISQLNPGMYYLLIEIDGEMLPQRFVKH